VWANAWKKILCQPSEEAAVLEAALADHRENILFRRQQGRTLPPESLHLDVEADPRSTEELDPFDPEREEDDLFVGETDEEFSGDEALA
jgi:hypothetical protein